MSKKQYRDRREQKDDRTSKETVQSKMYESLKFDASNIYFNNLVGTDLSTQENQTKNILPGILVFNSVANISSRSDMINIAATSIYTFVRHANSGRTNYESSDLMLYLLTMSEIYVGLAELIRAYGLSSYFTTTNLYSGRIVEALGFNPTTLRNNLADVRYAINVLINKTKAFAVPRAFNYFDERVSEFQNVYLDEPTHNAQMIAVRPSFLGVFDATSSETGGKISFEENNVDDRDIFEQIAKIDNMIEIARRNEDVNIISGDIMKAYGDNLYNIEPIAPEFQTEPVYDELSLIQFQNGHYAPGIEGLDIEQHNNKLLQYVILTGVDFGPFVAADRLLNSPIESIDSNLIFAISKYQMVSNDELEVESANTTILYKPNLYYFDGVNATFTKKTVQQYRVGNNPSAVDVILLSKFKHHPYLYVGTYAIPVGDMHFVAKLSVNDTNRMNDARFILAFQTLQMG